MGGFPTVVLQNRPSRSDPGSKPFGLTSVVAVPTSVLHTRSGDVWTRNENRSAGYRSLAIPANNHGGVHENAPSDTE